MFTGIETCDEQIIIHQLVALFLFECIYIFILQLDVHDLFFILCVPNILVMHPMPQMVSYAAFVVCRISEMQ